jgi:hypothetical protein
LCNPGVVTTSGFFLQKNYHSQVQYYHSQDAIVKPTGSDALLHHYKTQNYIYEKIKQLKKQKSLAVALKSTAFDYNQW